jgi:hypothetical protein
MAYSDKQSRVRGCLALLAIAAAVLALLYGWRAGGPYTSAVPRTFNSEGWKAAEGDTRCGMIADLQHRVGVVGRTRSDLYGMLGKPEDEDNRDPTLDHWHLCPSFMDIYILEVRWRDNRVAAAWVRDT